MPSDAQASPIRHAAWYLALITLIGAVLRLVTLTAAPPALHYDEAVYGLMAREIGHGYWPVYFSAYTGREPLYMYLMAGVFALLGSSEWTLRLTSALIGIATIPLAYLVFRPLYGQRIGLLGAALTALSYWHLSVSRAGYPNVLIPPIECLSAYFLLTGYRANSRWRMALGGAFIGLVLWTYLAARLWPITLALWALYALIVEPRQMLSRWQGWVLAVLACLLVFAPLGIHFLQHPEDFMERAGQVLVFSNATPGEIPRLLGRNLLQTLGGFFVKGDPRATFNLPGRPVFVPWIAPFFLWGVWRCLKHWREPAYMLLPIWTLGMCLPAILTRADMPQSQRMSGTMPAIFGLAALGLAEAWRWLERRPWRRAALIAPLAVIVLLSADGAVTAVTYLHTWADDPAVFYSEHGDYALITERAAQELAEGNTPVVIANHYKHPTAAFLQPQTLNAIWAVGNKTLVLPNRGTPVTYLWPTYDSTLRQELREVLFDSTTEQAPLLDPAGGEAVRVFALDPEVLAQEAALPVAATFGQEFGLLDWQIGDTLPRTKPVRLLLHWRALATVDEGRILSVHVVDEQGQVWMERTSLGFMPEQWQPGDTAYQLFELELPRGMPAGRYQAQLLMSHEGGQGALPVYTNGRLSGTYIDLGWFALTSEGGTFEARHGEDYVEMAPGLRLIEQGQWSDSARQGDMLALPLFWQATETPLPELEAEFVLLNDDGSVALSQTSALGLGYPTAQWQALEVVQTRYVLDLREAPAGTFQLQLHVGAATLDLGQLQIEAVERSFATPEMDVALEAHFGSEIDLLGYSLPDDVYHPGDVLPLTLHWRAAVQPQRDAKVFVHLVDEQGVLRAQRDAEPVDWSRPTSGWVAGEVLSDPEFISLPSELPPGDYTLYIGLYDAASLQRLDCDLGEDGRLRLTSVQVQ